MADVRKNIDVVIRAHDETAAAIGASSMSFSKMATSAAALSAAIGLVSFAVRSTISDLAALERRSRAFGVTTEELQRLDYAAKSFGANSDQVFAILQRLEAKAQDLAAPLAVLGIRYDELRQKDPTDQVLALAQGFARLEDHAIRSKVATQLFGQGGSDALALFSGSYEDLRKTIDKAPIIDDEVLESAERFDRLLGSIVPNLKAWAINTVDITKEWKDFNEELSKTFGFPWHVMNPWMAANRGRAGTDRPSAPPSLPFQLPGDLEPFLGGMVPTVRTSAASLREDPTRRLLLAVEKELEMRSLALQQAGAQIGPRGMRVGGSLRGMDFPGPVGMFPTSAEEEAQNKALEERVGHLADLRDAYDALRDGIQEVEVRGESLGATLVDGAFEWADAWSQGLALVMTKQAEFTDISKRLWRAMITDMISWINRLIARQIVSAILSAFLNRGGGTDIIQAVRNISASGGGGGGDGSYVTFERAARPPAVAMGDFGRNVTLNANISAAFASRSEMQAAAVHLVRYARAELGTA